MDFFTTAVRQRISSLVGGGPEEERRKKEKNKKNAAAESESPSEHPAHTLDSKRIRVSRKPSLRLSQCGGHGGQAGPAW